MKKSVDWAKISKHAVPLLREVLKPYIPDIADAIKRANAVRCPKCRRPQPEETVTYMFDADPEITCECGYKGEAPMAPPWTKMPWQKDET